MPDLPVDAVLPELCRALRDGRNAVLRAPPGAGKTTRIPLAFLDEPWLKDQRIVMLEPRRLAARAAARRMAEMLGENVGDQIGYRIRLENRVGPKTRIEVVTEGVLTRFLQTDPSLEGIGLIIFDEFHERSLHADLGLALTLEAQEGLRGDLRILVMSATLDGAPVADLLGGAPLITSEGRSFAVQTHYLEQTPKRVDDAVANAVSTALAEESGDILVFLPGSGEIRRVEKRLREAGVGAVVAPLYANLNREAQDLAINPSPPGQRKVVLATSIAETSLTIEGVRVVIDAGLARVSRFDPRTGMTRLETCKVSQAGADQRRGRAGRLAPGVCYRLWDAATQRQLAPFASPEIVDADLTPLALELAQWGTGDGSGQRWLDAPPPAHLAQARTLLQDLGALDANGRITQHGHAMLDLGLHPRLAHMVLSAVRLGQGGLACELAALLSEPDIMRGDGYRDADVRTRLEVLQACTAQRAQRTRDIDTGTVRRIIEAARRWQRQLGVSEAQGEVHKAGVLLAFAYPDRIALHRDGSDGHYLLANGRGAFFAGVDPLAAQEALVIAQLDGGERMARIFIAAPIDRGDLETHFGERIEAFEFIRWDSRTGSVQARHQRRLGALILDEAPLDAPNPEHMVAALLQGVRQHGLQVLPWSKAQRAWQARVLSLRQAGITVASEEGDWPDVSDAALLECLEEWLAPFVTGMTRLDHLRRLDLDAALGTLLGWRRQQALEELAPSHVVVPSGSRIALEYGIGDTPVLAVRLQEMFGARTTPCIAGGKLAVTLHLLSPAMRPVQVTRDLANFWANTYHEVKKDLKGRYPKHVWPDDPLQAVATSRAKPRPAKK